MRPAEKQSALEALIRSEGWGLVVEHVDALVESNVTRLLGIRGTTTAAQAPEWATAAATARKITDWPGEQIESIQRQLERGDTHGG